jgi:hypothetical protein
MFVAQLASRISRSCCPVAPMLILVETRKPRTWLVRYQPILSHTVLDYPHVLSPATLYFCTLVCRYSFPSHACPCTESCPLSCTYHSGMAWNGTCYLYCWPHINTCIFPYHPHTLPLINQSFRRFVDPVNLSRPLTSYVASLSVL